MRMPLQGAAAAPLSIINKIEWEEYAKIWIITCNCVEALSFCVGPGQPIPSCPLRRIGSIPRSALQRVRLQLRQALLLTYSALLLHETEPLHLGPVRATSTAPASLGPAVLWRKQHVRRNSAEATALDEPGVGASRASLESVTKEEYGAAASNLPGLAAAQAVSRPPRHSSRPADCRGAVAERCG